MNDRMRCRDDGPMGKCIWGKPHDRHCGERPHVKAVDAKETQKVTDIRDAFGNLRFKVALTCATDWYGDVHRVAYTVVVVNCSYDGAELQILQKPEDGEPPIFDYNYALNFYNECVKKYSDLVKAEVKDFQDISIYKEKIGYTVTCPECCMTCKWASMNKTQKDFVFGVSQKMVCMNPDNCLDYLGRDPEEDKKKFTDFHKRFPLSPNMPDQCCDIESQWQHHQHKFCGCQDEHIVIRPKIEPLGVCKNYFKKGEQYQPVPGDSIVSIVDKQIEKKFNDFTSSSQLSSAVENVTNDIISNVKVDAIIGNKCMDNMKDENGNGIPDDYEDVIICGNEGA